MLPRVASVNLLVTVRPRNLAIVTRHVIVQNALKRKSPTRKTKKSFLFVFRLICVAQVRRFFWFF